VDMSRKCNHDSDAIAGGLASELLCTILCTFIVAPILASTTRTISRKLVRHHSTSCSTVPGRMKLCLDM
jgi:hypothetical protein